VAVGANALLSNTTGSQNTAVGEAALQTLTTGNGNVAVGQGALGQATNDGSSTAIGYQALFTQTATGSNTAIGMNAGLDVTSGDSNTFVGYHSGQSVTTGRANVILGGYAGTSTMSSNIVLSDGDTNVRMQYAGGWLMGAATGGGQGVGTLNVSGGIYQNGTAYTNPAWVFDHHYDGGFRSTHMPPPTYRGRLPLAEAEAFVRQRHELPCMALLNGKQDIFAGGDLVLAALEEAYLYIFDLRREVDELKRRLLNG
jgi:hypothetical protein